MAAANPAIGGFLARLPPDLAASFSAAQLSAIDLHFAMRYRPRHAIDWRARLGWPALRIYFVILAGREHRDC